MRLELLAARLLYENPNPAFSLSSMFLGLPDGSERVPEMACNISNDSSSWVFSTDGNVSCMANPLDMLNPWRINEYFVVIVITYSVTFIIGVMGNVMAMFGLIGDRKTRSATNSFLVSLSAADLLLLLVCVPLETLQYFVIRWDETGTVCKMAKYVEALSAVASVLNLTAVSLERFIVIVFPMRSRSLCTLSNCRRAVLAVWLISLILTAPVIASKGSNPMIFTNGVDYVTIYYCSDRDEGGLVFSIYYGVILLVAPGLVMIVCYAYVIRELWISTQNMTLLTNSTKANRIGKNNSDRSRRSSVESNYPSDFSRGHGACLTPCHGPCSSNVQPSPCTLQVDRPRRDATRLLRAELPTETSKSGTFQTSLAKSKKSPSTLRKVKKTEDARGARKQVIKMLILVVVLFLGCWGPRILMEICIKLQWVSFTPMVYKTRIALYLLPFIHSCVNPLIYTLMSKNFRRSMARRCCVVTHHRHQNHLNNSNYCNCNCQYSTHATQPTITIDLDPPNHRLTKSDKARSLRNNIITVDVASDQETATSAL